MDLSTFDIPDVLIYAIPAIFWIAVIVQYLDQSRQVLKYQSTESCPRCKKRDIQAKIHLRNDKTNKRVSLLINIGGGLILINLSIILFRMFGIYMLDFIQDTNVTGIKNESSLYAKVGFTSFPLLLGTAFAGNGVALVKNYIVGKKRKEVNLRCLSCNTEFKPIDQEA